MLSVVSKYLVKSSLERNPNNARGNTIHAKKVGVKGGSEDKRAELLARFAKLSAK